MRLAIDTGGTFTDCVFVSDGQLRILKMPSTPAAPEQAVLQAVAQITNARPAEVRHGTTVGTNALLERKGARVAFVTTAGFEDTISIGRQARPKLYDLFFTKTTPLAPREMCFGVEERVASDGTVLRNPSPEQLVQLTQQIAAQQPESIGVSLLFSFANPDNERSVAEALCGLGVPLSLSHEILPEFREYERGSTVLINAYLAPIMQRYLETLDGGLRSAGCTLHVMQSSGGIIPASTAAREPVRTILSGPAGGVVGALAVAKQAGIDRILTFDMGGTSTDVALIDGANGLSTSTEFKILDMPVAVPMLDIHTVGAGGGSLASFDRGGALKVGPESAGANPGPICYGRGEQATVTDANLILGRLDPGGLLGGAMKLDEVRTRELMDRAKGRLASVEAFAEGIVELADVHMERALRKISVEQGRDPRDFALVSFGGAGPLHACSLASALKIPRVLVPNMPGALSAYGILVSDMIRDYSRTLMVRPERQPIIEQLKALEAQARREIEGNAAWSVDMRYAGQGYELPVPWSDDFIESFHRMHQQRYGYADRTRDIQVVTARVRMTAASEQVKFSDAENKANESVSKDKRIYWNGEWHDAKVYARANLKRGEQLAGPAIVTEYSATTFLPPDCEASVDSFGNLIIHVSQ